MELYLYLSMYTLLGYLLKKENFLRASSHKKVWFGSRTMVSTKHSYERVFSAVCFKIWYGYKVKPEQQPDFPCKMQWFGLVQRARGSLSTN